MHRFLVVAIFIASILAAPVSSAQGKTGFKCSFGPGSQANWDTGKLKAEKANFGNPSVTVHFDSIDLKAGTARMIGNGGSSDLTVLESETSITLIEQTRAKNFSFTTIFLHKIKSSSEFPGVMSRHIATPAGPMPSQYYGSCVLW